MAKILPELYPNVYDSVSFCQMGYRRRMTAIHHMEYEPFSQLT